jgi:hypothetical protein
MAGRIFLPALAVLFCFAPSAPAQNREAALDALHWFPEGAYDYLAFCDWTGLKKTIVFSDFGEVLTNSQFSHLVESSPLPESTRESLEWICAARLLHLRLANEEEMVEMGQVRTIVTVSPDGVSETRKEKPSREEILDQSVRGDEKSLWIISFDDTRAVVKDGLAAGWLSRTGESFKGRPFFSVSAGADEGGQSAYFAYPTVTNELLVADDLELLKSMAAAGMGQDSSFVDGTEFTDLSPFIPDLGQSWQVSLVRPRNRQMMELWKDHPEMEQRVSELEEQCEKGLQYEITSFEARDTIVERTISIFGSDEFASRSAEEIKQKFLKDKEDFKQRSTHTEIIIMDDNGEVYEQHSGLRDRLFNRSSLLSSNKAGKTDVFVEDNIVMTVFVWGEKELQTFRFLKKAAEAADSQDQVHTQVTSQAEKAPHRP